MGLYQVAAILGFSIVVASVLGMFRYKKVSADYYPFFFILWLAAINHVLSIVMVEYFQSNAINANLYVLVESVLYIEFFRRTRLFKKESFLPLILIFLLIAVWVTDNIIVHQITRPNAGYRIVSSFLLLVLAVEQVVRLIPSIRERLFKNAVFCICLGMILYFSFKACIEVFFLIQKDISVSLQIKIYALLVYLNFFVNLFFAWAVLWIPRKKPYSLLR